MTPDPEDPRLTAYVLGELGPDDAAAVERAAAADPAVRAEIEEIRNLGEQLTDRLSFMPDELHPHQLEDIRRRSRLPAKKQSSVSFSSVSELMKSWLIPASAAAVLTLATVILLHMPADEPKPQVRTTPAAAPEAAAHLPAPGPVDTSTPPPAATPAAQDPAHPALVQRGSVNAAEYPLLDLPVRSGGSSYGWITQSILVDHKRPAPNTVRLEEILNHFTFRLNGTTSIARGGVNGWHPDQRGTGVSAHTATVTTEMIACPWKPSSTLLFISLRGSGNQDTECQVKLTYQTNPGTVARYRLLGFAPVEGSTPGPMPSALAANSAITLAIEIEPSSSEGDYGSLIWSTDGKAAPAIPLIRKPDAEPSDDARFAALVCTYSQWLAGEQAGLIDADILSALARELASSTLPPERAGFLTLIDRSLHLEEF
ncbi:hypothetical protein JIN84_08285 [Luteolibacter yonseiensis]|uniref:Zinc-finger domain-containing protein n=1 Tax=Luteolibacter yonseiensis TaxID=1144680 RepID=A0A934R524_9BACT|nr:hypothetical protein [Luteolibacter yonseiensis]MBK1815610.1 hypothetical protein [Luteolibacter yonseiensis]